MNVYEYMYMYMRWVKNVFSKSVFNYEKDMFFCLFICMVTLYTIMINNDFV